MAVTFFLSVLQFVHFESVENCEHVQFLRFGMFGFKTQDITKTDLANRFFLIKSRPSVNFE